MIVYFSAENSSCVGLDDSFDVRPWYRLYARLQARHSSGPKYNFGMILKIAKLYSIYPVDSLVQPTARQQHMYLNKDTTDFVNFLENTEVGMGKPLDKHIAGGRHYYRV